MALKTLGVDFEKNVYLRLNDVFFLNIKSSDLQQETKTDIYRLLFSLYDSSWVKNNDGSEATLKNFNRWLQLLDLSHFYHKPKDMLEYERFLKIIDCLMTKIEQKYGRSKVMVLARNKRKLFMHKRDRRISDKENECARFRTQSQGGAKRLQLNSDSLKSAENNQNIPSSANMSTSLTSTNLSSMSAKKSIKDDKPVPCTKKEKRRSRSLDVILNKTYTIETCQTDETFSQDGSMVTGNDDIESPLVNQADERNTECDASSVSQDLHEKSSEDQRIPQDPKYSNIIPTGNQLPRTPPDVAAVKREAERHEVHSFEVLSSLMSDVQLTDNDHDMEAGDSSSQRECETDMLSEDRETSTIPTTDEVESMDSSSEIKDGELENPFSDNEDTVRTTTPIDLESARSISEDFKMTSFVVVPDSCTALPLHSPTSHIQSFAGNETHTVAYASNFAILDNEASVGNYLHEQEYPFPSEMLVKPVNLVTSDDCMTFRSNNRNSGEPPSIVGENSERLIMLNSPSGDILEESAEAISKPLAVEESCSKVTRKTRLSKVPVPQRSVRKGEYCNMNLQASDTAIEEIVQETVTKHVAVDEEPREVLPKTRKGKTKVEKETERTPRRRRNLRNNEATRKKIAETVCDDGSFDNPITRGKTKDDPRKDQAGRNGEVTSKKNKKSLFNPKQEFSAYEDRELRLGNRSISEDSESDIPLSVLKDALSTPINQGTRKGILKLSSLDEDSILPVEPRPCGVSSIPQPKCTTRKLKGKQAGQPRSETVSNTGKDESENAKKSEKKTRKNSKTKDKAKSVVQNEFDCATVETESTRMYGFRRRKVVNYSELNESFIPKGPVTERHVTFDLHSEESPRESVLSNGNNQNCITKETAFRVIDVQNPNVTVQKTRKSRKTKR